MASTAHCSLNTNLVFEEVSEVLKAVAAADENAMIFVETDALPCFRHAYPYHAKVFLMTTPVSLGNIFRTPTETAGAIDKAMNDTAEFAAQIFGLEQSSHDSAVLPAVDPGERKAYFGSAQSVEEFLASDVGTEITSRMQLQPEYHSIIESDVVLLNEALGRNGDLTEQCAQRIETLLENLRLRLDRQPWFAVCDPADERDSLAQRALQKIEALLKAAKESA